MSEPHAPVTLQNLVDDVAIISAEAQARMADLHADDAWEIDLGAGMLTFTAPSGVTVDCEVQFIGSASRRNGTWLWAWENVNGFPGSVLVAARHVHAIGSAIPELREARLALTDGLPFRLVLAAKALTHTFTHYRAPVRGGTTAWFLLDHPSFAFDAPTLESVTRSIAEGVATTSVVDHWRAVASYASRRGLTLSAGSDGTLSIHIETGTVMVRFDEDGHVDQVVASARAASGTDEPTPEAEFVAERNNGDWEFDDTGRPHRKSWFRRRT